MSKLIAITGVNGGIGRALAEEFQNAGFKIIGIDLAPTTEMINVDYYKCNLTDDEASLKTFTEIKLKYPEISHWINNAGVARLGEFRSVAQTSFDEVMAINFRAQVTATRFWLSYFEEQKSGHIINMASVAGLIPAGEMTSYVASKHAVVGFTRSLQLELDVRKSPVHLSLVTPGFVETQIMNIGKSSGFPEKLKFMVSSPESCAKEIVKSVLELRKEIVPTMSGKLMTSFYRLPFGEKLAGNFYKSSKKNL